jgi:hypothetical protein
VTDQPTPELSDPTQCSGEEGFCPEHGYHRHSLKQPAPAVSAPDAIPGPLVQLRARLETERSQAHRNGRDANHPEVALANSGIAAGLDIALHVLEKAETEAAPAPDAGLREQQRTVIRNVLGDGPWDVIAEHITDAVLAVRDRRMEQLAAGRETWKAKALEMEADRDRSDEAARRILDQRQELAAERYEWQQRALQAEATIERMKRTNRMVNGGARDARIRAEKAETTNEGVRKLADQWRRIPRLEDTANQILAALDQQSGEGR